MSDRYRFALVPLFAIALSLSACLEDAPVEEPGTDSTSTQAQPLEFGGVGVSLTAHHGAVLIAAVQDGSPAAESALGVHDQVLSIDGVPVEDLDLSTVVELARGPVGTDVAYELRSLDGQVRTVAMERVGMSLSEEAYRAELRRDRDFGGVGIALGPAEEGALVIRSTVPGLPAEQAGLRAGERIVAVDGVDLTDQPIEEYLSRIRGLPGSSVTLELVGEAAETRTVTLERAAIVLPSRGHCGGR